jgi:hypothetical protein
MKRSEERQGPAAVKKLALALSQAAEALNAFDLADFKSRASPPPPPAKPTAITMHADYVTIRFAAILTGLSQPAIRCKIGEGKWLEGREYRRSPDGHVFISMVGYAKWVERGRA